MYIVYVNVLRVNNLQLQQNRQHSVDQCIAPSQYRQYFWIVAATINLYKDTSWRTLSSGRSNRYTCTTLAQKIDELLQKEMYLNSSREKPLYTL